MITRGNANPFLSASAVQALLHRRTPVLFLGNGPRTQYADVNAVMESADVPLRQLRKEFGDSLIAVFGGDTCIEGEPDLGVLMREVKGRHDMPLLAVVGWDEVDQHIDFAFRYVTKQSEDSGREVYGGFDSSTGVPLGGTAVYLGQWLSQLRAVVAFEPRGSVGTCRACIRARHPWAESNRGASGGTFPAEATSVRCNFRAIMCESIFFPAPIYPLHVHD